MKTLKRLPFMHLKWWLEDYGIRLFMAVGFLVGFFTYFYMYFITPPITSADYEPLYEQQQLILSNPACIEDMSNVVITISNTQKTYLLTTKRCSLQFIVDKQLGELLSTQKFGETMSPLAALGASFLCGIFAGFITFAVYIFIFCIFLPFSSKLINFVKTRKNTSFVF